MRKWVIKRDGGEVLATVSGPWIERGFHRSQWILKDRDGKWVATLYMAIHLGLEEISAEAPPAPDKSSPSEKLPNGS